MDEKIEVYAKIDDAGHLLAINGGYTVPVDLSGWLKIDEGCGERYNLCQTHYLAGGLYTADGIPRYKLSSGKPIERTAKEIEKDRLSMPAPAPTDSERLSALESAVLAMMGVSSNV